MSDHYRPADPAMDAAYWLIVAGHHVHHVSSGQVRCLTGGCTRKDNDPR